MDVSRRVWGWGLWLPVVLAGCGTGPQPPAGTSAAEAVRGFYTALLRQDWPRAYAALHAESRSRWSPEQFARLAAQYRRDLGFEPEQVHVRSCEERGAEATAHVVFTGPGASGPRFFKEAVRLRRGPDGWGVVLAQKFGRARAPGRS
jgi:hypothetical protein